MTENGYIIRILQHFATKLRNITNSVMLFQAVMKFLSRLVEIKILVIRGKVHSNTEKLYFVVRRGSTPNGQKWQKKIDREKS